MEKAVPLFFILALCHSGVRVVAQDIVLERIEQDLSQLPCPQQTVKYLCEVMVPSFSLTWTIPTGDLLEFSTSRDVGEIRNSTDNVYSANLTSRMEDTDPDSDRFFFSSTLLILETVNGSTITCTGAGTDPVEDSTDITLSGPPDPPSGLKYVNSMVIETSVELKWSKPSYTGGVPLMNYSVTANGGTLSVSDSSERVNYTTSGLVYGVIEVTAVNYCGQQSQPDSLNIPAAVPPKLSNVSVDFNCENTSLDITWMYGPLEMGVVYPSTNLRLESSRGVAICTDVTIDSTDCSIKLERGVYEITLNQSNMIDSTIDRIMFDSRVLTVENVMLQGGEEDTLSLSVTVNRVCEATEVLVKFGVVSAVEDCAGQQEIRKEPPPGDPTVFSVETKQISLGKGEEYCYIVSFGGDFVVTGSGGTESNVSPTSGPNVAPNFALIVGVAVGVLLLLVVAIVIVVIFLMFCVKKKNRGDEAAEMAPLGDTYQDPDSIQRTAHPETGELYTQVDLNERNRELEQAGATALYQDPSTIQHEEGPSGDVYAMPQKTGKKKKEKEAEDEEMSEEQKAALYSVPDRKSKSEGLEYAQLDIQPSVKQAPPSKGSTYVDIRYD